MRFLFVHQNFPAQFLHIVRHLSAQRQHEIVFLTQPNANEIAGVRKVPYTTPPPQAAATHWTVREFETAARRAEMVAGVAANLKALGFTPDIVIGHHGWGELLNLSDVWPSTPLLGFYEFYYHTSGADVGFDPEFPTHPADYPRIRAKNAVNHLALTQGGHGLSPTDWQRSTYPAWARERITLLREGFDLEVCKPDPAVRRETLRFGALAVSPDDKLVTYVVRDLEPYRGFHTMMRAVPHLLAARPDIKIVMVGGDGVSYGAAPPGMTWRQMMLRELAGRIDPDRLAFPGRIPYGAYVRLLQRSDAHVYLTYPFVASWSLREALAVGCALVGSDTEPVREFVRHQRNGLLASFFDPKRIAEAALSLIEDGALSQRLRIGARRYAERHLAMPDYIEAYLALIGRLVGDEVAPAARRPVRALAG